MQYRSLTNLPVEQRAEGIFGYAAMFNSLSHDLGGYREKIANNAFDRSLKEVQDGKRVVSLRVQHEGGLSTVGTTANGSLELGKDKIGLWYYAKTLPDTQAGRDTLTLVSGGYINKSSFAFSIPDKNKGVSWDFNANPPVRTLLDVDLIDVAPVDGPAYEATSVEARNLILSEMKMIQPTNCKTRIETRKDASVGTSVELYMLDEIVPTWISRYLPDTVSSGKIIEALSSVPDVQRIDVFINSPGGDVFEGMAIYNTLKQHPAPVNVYVRGLAASAASLVAMAGDTITMGEGTFMMVHNAWSVVAGNARDLRDQAMLLDKIDGEIGGILASRSKNSEKQIQRWMRDETWFTAAEAVAAGMADRVSGAADPVDGERCREIGYRNIPRDLGGSVVTTRRAMTMDDYRAAVTQQLTRSI